MKLLFFNFKFNSDKKCMHSLRWFGTDIGKKGWVRRLGISWNRI